MLIPTSWPLLIQWHNLVMRSSARLPSTAVLNGFGSEQTPNSHEQTLRAAAVTCVAMPASNRGGDAEGLVRGGALAAGMPALYPLRLAAMAAAGSAYCCDMYAPRGDAAAERPLSAMNFCCKLCARKPCTSRRL